MPPLLTPRLLIVTAASTQLVLGCNVDSHSQPTENSELSSIRSALTAPASGSLKLKRVGQKYEIQINDPAGFRRGQFDPSLFIGETRFGSYRYASSERPGEVTFYLTAAEFEPLEEGALVRVEYLGRTRTFGTLNKSAVEARQ